MTLADDLEKLNGLREQGVISDADFEKGKAALLAREQPVGEKVKEAMDGVATDTNLWGMFIHLSQFFGFFVPLAGLVVPIVLWQVKKNDAPIIDLHGRIVVNWLLTEIILAIVFVLLCMVLIGIPLLLALVVVGIIFPIIGAVKANNGEAWVYPCSIPFFKVREAVPMAESSAS